VVTTNKGEQGREGGRIEAVTEETTVTREKDGKTDGEGAIESID
jgi:hypothetical protein